MAASSRNKNAFTIMSSVLRGDVLDILTGHPVSIACRDL